MDKKILEAIKLRDYLQDYFENYEQRKEVILKESEKILKKLVKAQAEHSDLRREYDEFLISLHGKCPACETPLTSEKQNQLVGCLDEFQIKVKTLNFRIALEKLRNSIENLEVELDNKQKELLI